MRGRKKYIIWNFFPEKCAGGYDPDHRSVRTSQASGGVLAIYKLFENMKNLGEEVYLAFEVEQFIPGLQKYEEGDFFSVGVSELVEDTAKMGSSLENFRQLDLDECVTIYPEAAFNLRMESAIGNPIGSKHVVRWLLHYPGYHLGSGPETWGENDLLFAYEGGRCSRPWVTKKSEEMGYKVNGNLTPSFHVSHDIFKDRNESRLGTCYVSSKDYNILRSNNELEGAGEGEIDQLPLDSTPIASLVAQGDPYLLADVFNQYENFYSYDYRTALSSLAALCGCNSIMAYHPEPREIFFEGVSNYWRYGIAYGVDDINHAKETKHLLKDELAKDQKACLLSVKNFIDYTKKSLT